MKRLLMAAVVVAFGVTGTTACATKGYVKKEVGQVSTKVDTLSQSLEATQERTRQNEAKIAEVDQKAQAGIKGAQDAALTADGKAVTADGKATTWGLGVSVDSAPRLRISHNGKQSEATSRMVFSPRQKHGVVVMTNCDFADVGKISTAVYSALSQ